MSIRIGNKIIASNLAADNFAKSDLSNLTVEGQQVVNNPFPRFCVNSASIDENGNPNFITELNSSNVCSVTALAPFTYTTAQGKTYTQTTNLVSNEITITADTSLRIILDREDNANVLKLVNCDVYKQKGTPISPNTNDLWVDLSTFPNICKLYNGSAWDETEQVDVGLVDFKYI